MDENQIIKDKVLQNKIEDIIDKTYKYLKENGVINPNKHPAHYKLFRNVLIVEIDQLINSVKEEWKETTKNKPSESGMNSLKEALIRAKVKECVKEADSVQNPYPKSIFPMDTDGYVKAIPDEHLRTAISGYCGRIFFDIAKKEISKAIKDSKE